jgi:hypothetical protein
MSAKCASAIYWVTSVPLVLFEAWLMTILWQWFVLPVFGWDTPSVLHMVGLMTLGLMFRSMPKSIADPHERLRGVGYRTLYVLVLFGLGWLIHLGG